VICAARTKKQIVATGEEGVIAEKQVIAVPPDMAFGTGHHATTATVLSQLVDRGTRDFRTKGAALEHGGPRVRQRHPGHRGAANSGLTPVWGCDFDPKAVEVVTRERCRAMACRRYRFDAGGRVIRWQPQAVRSSWNVVAANLFADILEDAFPDDLIQSGETEWGGAFCPASCTRRRMTACAAGEAAGLVIERRWRVGKWVTALARRVAG
jgi:ribosomal protein L11 methyltransferase